MRWMTRRSNRFFVARSSQLSTQPLSSSSCRPPEVRPPPWSRRRRVAPGRSKCWCELARAGERPGLTCLKARVHCPRRVLSFDSSLPPTTLRLQGLATRLQRLSNRLTITYHTQDSHGTCHLRRLKQTCLSQPWTDTPLFISPSADQDRIKEVSGVARTRWRGNGSVAAPANQS